MGVIGRRKELLFFPGEALRDFFFKFFSFCRAFFFAGICFAFFPLFFCLSSRAFARRSNSWSEKYFPMAFFFSLSVRVIHRNGAFSSGSSNGITGWRRVIKWLFFFAFNSCCRFFRCFLSLVLVRIMRSFLIFKTWSVNDSLLNSSLCIAIFLRFFLTVSRSAVSLK